MKLRIIITALLLSIFSNSANAKSAFGNEDVKQFIHILGNSIIQTANQKELSESQKIDKIVSLVDEAIDHVWIARFVLGKNYRTANDEQKKQFIELYHQFMIHTYGPKFKNYNGRKFTVKEVRNEGGFYIVKTEFLPRDSDVVILADFRVKERKERLAVLDFVTEGVSLIGTQRSEFNSAISNDGMEKFLENLAERVKKLEKK